MTHKPLEFLHIQTAQVSKSDNVLPQRLDITSHVSTMWAQQNASPCYMFYRFPNASQQQNNNFMELLELHKQFKIQLFDLNCSSSSSFLIKYGTLERTEIRHCFKGGDIETLRSNFLDSIGMNFDVVSKPRCCFLVFQIHYT